MSLKENLILLCFSYVFLILPVFGQQYPLVNCPEVFKYAYDLKYGGHYGLVTVKKDESSISEIQINMSVNAQEHVYVSSLLVFYSFCIFILFLNFIFLTLQLSITVYKWFKFGKL